MKKIRYKSLHFEIENSYFDMLNFLPLGCQIFIFGSWMAQIWRNKLLECGSNEKQSSPQLCSRVKMHQLFPLPPLNHTIQPPVQHICGIQVMVDGHVEQRVEEWVLSPIFHFYIFCQATFSGKIEGDGASWIKVCLHGNIFISFFLKLWITWLQGDK